MSSQLLTHFLSQYGYLALFIGCLLEGETMLLLAGFATHDGYLSLPIVILTAFVSGALGDTLYFLLGKFFGPRLLARFPRITRQSDRVNQLLYRHQRLIIVGIRFMYGLRVAGPVIIGNSGIPLWRFIHYNLIGAALWAILIGGCGYLFGQTIQWLFTDIGHYQWVAVLGLLLIAGIGHRLLRKRRRQTE